MITAILIDDEQLGRDALRKSLELYCPEVKLLCECSNADEGKSNIESLKPDLVFLDIAMPVKNGFDLLKSLKEHTFEVIFVTAHDEYTIQAIRYSAVDYLLKPIDEIELVGALARVKKRLTEKSGKESIQTFLENTGKKLPYEEMQLCVASTKGFQVFKISDIVCCEAQNSYTVFYLLNNKQIVSSKPLGDYENLLTDVFFVRIHKSWLINMKHIKEYRKGEGGSIVMATNKELEVSRRKKDYFLQELKKIFKY